MNAVPQDELIGAYLDGELTAEERARVEQLLAESPECRQLLDDLRAVRESLQALPRLSLEADFSDKVLREAERRMLTAAPGGKDSALRRGEPPTLRHRTWRPVLVSGLAVAAALVVMFLNRPGFLGEGPVDKGPVAMAPGAAERAHAPAEPAPRGESLGRAEESIEKHAQGWYDEEGGRSGAMPVHGRLDARLVRKTESGRANQTATEGEALNGTAAGERFLRAGKTRALPPVAAPAPPAAAPEKPAAPTIAAGKPSTSEPFDGKPTLEGMGLAGKPNEGKIPVVGGKAGGGFAESSTPSAVPAPKSPSGNRDERILAEKQAPVEPLLVVQCQISPQAARSRAFDDLLLKHEIVLADTVDKYGGSAGGHFAANAAPQAPVDVKSDGTVHSANGDLDLVYVEASPEQIEATMASLQAQPNLFLAVTVTPSPSTVAPQNLGYYRWQFPASGAMKQAVTPARLPAGEEKAKMGTAAGQKTAEESLSQRLVDQPADSSSARARRAGAPAGAVQRGSQSQFFGQQKSATATPPRQSAEKAPQPPPETMRVLFVLRVVAPPAADASIQLAKPAAAAVEPAKPAAEAPAESTGKAAK